MAKITKGVVITAIDPSKGIRQKAVVKGDQVKFASGTYPKEKVKGKQVIQGS